MARRLRELALWAGAALGLLAIATGLAVTLLGFSFLVFRSGSMEPEIPTGGLAFSRTVDAADIEVGDVVSVVADNGERITHRVVSTTLRGDEATLVLQGDANGAPDSEPYVVESAEKVVASVPYGGYVVAHALTPPGLLAVACFSLMLVVLGFGRPEDQEDTSDDEGVGPDGGRQPDQALTLAPAAAEAARPGKYKDEHAHRRQRGAVAAVLTGLVVAAVALTGLGTHGTLARFTDTPSVTTGTFRAATAVAPSNVTCSNRYITWTAPPTGTATGYRVYYTPVNGSNTQTADVTGTQWRPSGTFLTSTTYDVRVATKVGNAWVSPQSATTGRIEVFGSVFTSWSCP